MRVRVTAGGRSVVVRLTDWCGCYGTRLIDLSDDAFSRLAPLSVGLVGVEIP
jgi:rare lipoprotein A (peptidoglycan hydrolase)